MDIKVDLTNSNIEAVDVERIRPSAHSKLEELRSGVHDFTGWVKHPLNVDDEAISDIISVADEIRSKCDVFLVLGVGGSYVGAKAVIDMLGATGDTEVIFAGYNFSARYARDIIAGIDGKDICLCVISKSGSTAETMAAYGIFKEYMLDRYGDAETAARTYVVTENRSNRLFDMAASDGCRMFYLDEDIGGRYSVLTPVGLLPIAVAGIDVSGIIRGAASLAGEGAFSDEDLDYAITRYLQYGRGSSVEVFEFFDPYFEYFGEWLKQLFGESEGKDDIGIFPTTLQFSRDLHSMGQFLQQGSACWFETMITVENPTYDITIPDTATDPYAGKTLEQINKCAEMGVADAHISDGKPLIRISIPVLDERHVGELIYYFETECAVSALLSGVDPFDQPGVENYKREMKAHIAEL